MPAQRPIDPAPLLDCSSFSKLAGYGYKGWAVLEWECCPKRSEDGAAAGAPFIDQHIIRVTDKAFDDFAGGTADAALVKRSLGLS